MTTTWPTNQPTKHMEPTSQQPTEQPPYLPHDLCWDITARKRDDHPKPPVTRRVWASSGVAVAGWGAVWISLTDSGVAVCGMAWWLERGRCSPQSALVRPPARLLPCWAPAPPPTQTQVFSTGLPLTVNQKLFIEQFRILFFWSSFCINAFCLCLI